MHDNLMSVITWGVQCRFDIRDLKFCLEQDFAVESPSLTNRKKKKSQIFLGIYKTNIKKKSYFPGKP